MVIYRIKAHTNPIKDDREKKATVSDWIRSPQNSILNMVRLLVIFFHNNNLLNHSSDGNLSKKDCHWKVKAGNEWIIQFGILQNMGEFILSTDSTSSLFLSIIISSMSAHNKRAVHTFNPEFQVYTKTTNPPSTKYSCGNNVKR